MVTKVASKLAFFEAHFFNLINQISRYFHMVLKQVVRLETTSCLWLTNFVDQLQID